MLYSKTPKKFIFRVESHLKPARTRDIKIHHSALVESTEQFERCKWTWKCRYLVEHVSAKFGLAYDLRVHRIRLKADQTLIGESMMDNFDDIPINNPSKDKFGFYHIAESIAETIVRISKPEGAVISIYGAWGTGKSSMVNLIKHSIRNDIPESKLKIIELNLWWFKGEEAIAMEFFRKLCSEIGASHEQIAMLGSQLLGGLSPMIGPLVNILLPGLGSVASEMMDLTKKQIEQQQTVESLHKQISKRLEESKRKLLIVIDDIDRLSPDEALLVFRLVKSVGRLPNVIYLMAYDRAIAEKAVSSRYPSEGSHYLEKIIQAGFDVPSIPQARKIKILQEFLTEIWGEKIPDEDAHYWSIMRGVVIPEIKSFRNLLRLKNMLEVSWRPVSGEVDPLDFLGIEIIRIKRPKLYYILKQSKNYLTDHGLPGLNLFGTQTELFDFSEKLFLSGLSGEEKMSVKRALVCLFPPIKRTFSKLERLIGESSFNEDDIINWSKNRRVCSSKHFDTYFRFLPSEYNISLNESNQLIENCDKPDYIKSALLSALISSNGSGGTRASTLLDELELRADEIQVPKIKNFLVTLFSLNDRIYTYIDGIKSPYTNNNYRIYKISRKITMNLSIEDRSELIISAAKQSGGSFLFELSQWAYREYNPREGDIRVSEENRNTTIDDMNKLQLMAQRKIQQAASDGTLLHYRSLVRILLLWDRFTNDLLHEKHEKPGFWCRQQMDIENSLERFSELFVMKSNVYEPQNTTDLDDTYVAQ